jgi:hypothetical protein
LHRKNPRVHAAKRRCHDPNRSTHRHYGICIANSGHCTANNHRYIRAGAASTRRIGRCIRKIVDDTAQEVIASALLECASPKSGNASSRLVIASSLSVIAPTIAPTASPKSDIARRFPALPTAFRSLPGRMRHERPAILACWRAQPPLSAAAWTYGQVHAPTLRLGSARTHSPDLVMRART